eukprot:1160739-Pelagomonas_calceolata.AAC.10
MQLRQRAVTNVLPFSLATAGQLSKHTYAAATLARAGQPSQHTCAAPPATPGRLSTHTCAANFAMSGDPSMATTLRAPALAAKSDRMPVPHPTSKTRFPEMRVGLPSKAMR